VISSGDTAAAINLDLAPYQAAVIVLHDSSSPELVEPTPELVEGQQPNSLAASTGSAPMELATWTATFPDGDPVEVRLPHRWEDDPDRVQLSGTVCYTTTVDLDRSFIESGRVMIDFGSTSPVDAGSPERQGIRGNSYRVEVTTPIGEIAQVIVNGSPCGVLWAPPYRLEIADLLRPGPNEIRLLISNTTANALAADTAIHRLVEQSHQRYGRRFVMQDLDRAMDGVSSGVLTVPVLRQTGCNDASRALP
jgi:hypothetical protein